MSVKNRLIGLLCFALMSIMIFALPCMAAMPECELTVLLEDESGVPVNGLSVSVCRVAEIIGSDYYPAEGFENSGISIAGIVNSPSGENAETLLKYIRENELNAVSKVSENGMAVFTSLEAGIWVVFSGDGQTHFFNPFIVFLPDAEHGELVYEITSSPKVETDTPDNKSIYVLKKWMDDNNAAGKRPDSITVHLKHNGEVIETVTLGEGNGWAHTFAELPDEGNYSVVEEPVSEYTAAYNGDSENGFVITNTYNKDLPQTGQLWWPIAIASVAGVLLIVFGIIEMRSKKNTEK